MTKNEAIEILKGIKYQYAEEMIYSRGAIDIAIQALEENEQLKAEIARLKAKEVAINQKVIDLTNTNDSDCKDYEDGWYDCLKSIKNTLDWSE